MISSLLLLSLLLAMASSESSASAPIPEEFAVDPGWRPIHDVVMGGRSSGDLVVEEGVGIFRGRVSLADGGGFASVRSPVGRVDLSGAEAIEMRVRGDGKTYSLRLRDDAGVDGVNHEARFRAPEEWEVLRLPLDELKPVFRGRSLPGHPSLDRSRVRTVGLLVGQKQEGPFRLEIDWIRASGPDD